MKKHVFFITFGLALLLFSGAAWGAENTPAILAALDNAGVTILDDSVIEDIRGQAQYTMVKVLGINTWDFSRDVDWTLNPLGFRYGHWGGAFYTNEGVAVDEMDALFEMHDKTQLSDESLLALLKGDADPQGSSTAPLCFGEDPDPLWGWIYQPNAELYKDVDPDHFDYKVYVSKVSWMSAGGRFFFGWRAMPLTEYARREAVMGMGILTAF